MSPDVPLVSVVIPSRNRRARLERALASVWAQTLGDFEVIVVDDASDDGTQQALANIAASEPRLRTIRHDAPRGGAGARNTGIAAARGEFVAFLDDDDVWLPEKLARQVAVLRANPQASAVSASFVIDAGGGRRLAKILHPPRDADEIIHANHLGGASVCCTTRAALERIGGFDPTLRSAQDWDLWIKLNDLGPVLVCPEPLVVYHTHEGARITGNPVAVYTGRRRVFVRYRGRMSAAARGTQIRELLYCRKVMLKSGRLAELVGLFGLMRYTGMVKGVRYVYRYARMVFPGLSR